MKENAKAANRREKAENKKKKERGNNFFSERQIPPRVGCIVLAVVAVVIFVTSYFRIASVWQGTDKNEFILLAVICGTCSIASMVLLETYLYFEKRYILTSPKRLAAVSSLIVLAVVLSAFTTIISFAFTAAFVAIILCGLLVSKRAAYTMTVTMAGVMMLMTVSGYGSGVLDKPVAAALAIFFGGIVSVIALNGQSNRLQPVISGAIGGAAAALVLSAVQAFSGVDFKTIAIDSGWMFAGCLLSGIIATGLLPLFERVFDISTEARLNELMNNNNPLLKRLMLEAPGTYHHSLIVAVMAESAAEQVGANALLCKTAAYYHDIGKLVSPRYFKENQGEYNVHDELAPEVSAAHILAHPKDSAQMLSKKNFPSDIIRMAANHHGDSIVYYFYTKAREQAAVPDSVNINDYRYESQKPQTKEDAILMLADCCEAAVRALKRPTQEMIEERVKNVINGLWLPADGQLSESPITAKDIRTIEASFIKNLLAQYHERIEYPANPDQVPPQIQSTTHDAELPADDETNEPGPYTDPDNEPQQDDIAEKIAEQRAASEYAGSDGDFGDENGDQTGDQEND